MEEIYEQKYHHIEKRHFWFKARRSYLQQQLFHTTAGVVAAAAVFLLSVRTIQVL